MALTHSRIDTASVGKTSAFTNSRFKFKCLLFESGTQAPMPAKKVKVKPPVFAEMAVEFSTVETCAVVWDTGNANPLSLLV